MVEESLEGDVLGGPLDALLGLDGQDGGSFGRLKVNPSPSASLCLRSCCG